VRFELTVALKYLIPRWRQLSVSIISLVSILVISLVVWLVVLFLSVTEGIEKKWVEQLVALNAPVRLAPTDAYYRSYYYQVDSVSLDSNYTHKTIGEKLATLESDPYDLSFDMELPYDFPSPDRREDGTLKDPVKEGYEAIAALGSVRPQEYEVSYSNLSLNLMRNNTEQTFLNQISYIASHDEGNTRMKQMLIPPSAEDYNNILSTLETHELENFFAHVQVDELQTTEEGFVLPPSFFPETGTLKGVGVVRYHEVKKVVLPQSVDDLDALDAKLSSYGLETTPVEVIFDEEQMHLASEKNVAQGVELVLDDQIPFQAKLIDSSPLQFEIEGEVQGIPLTGTSRYDKLEIAKGTPLKSDTQAPWIQPDESGCAHIPCNQPSGDGILIANHFQKSGVRLGDRGHLSYYTPTASSRQEQRILVYVAGFYDPGMMPVGNKLLFVDPQVVALLRGNMSVSDGMLGNGINLWLSDISQAEMVKSKLTQALDAREIGKYWKVQSYQDYDFAKPVLQQLKSDKNLFTLIAVIILIVACSNIISMLILLVNDKKKEIGILQSMGASPRRIAVIFGICGFVTGIISSILGTFAAIFTLKHLQSLVNVLSFLQGHEAFQEAFYGNQLPNELSMRSLVFVIVATMVISLLAGIVPAIKAARIRPTEILRAE